jgi:hypothetical protein
MSEKSEKKFYWVEGITRDEVVRSLADNSPSVFRKQKNRRILILLISFLIIVLALSVFIEQPKVRSYLEIATLASVLILYFKLRASVRHVADAPDELLDERLIAIRNAGYLDAYRNMAGISVVYIFTYLLIASEIFSLPLPTSETGFSQTIVSYFMWLACMPSMVLAWTMPSERPASQD